VQNILEAIKIAEKKKSVVRQSRSSYSFKAANSLKKTFKTVKKTNKAFPGGGANRVNMVQKVMSDPKPSGGDNKQTNSAVLKDTNVSGEIPFFFASPSDVPKKTYSTGGNTSERKPSANVPKKTSSTLKTENNISEKAPSYVETANTLNNDVKDQAPSPIDQLGKAVSALKENDITGKAARVFNWDRKWQTRGENIQEDKAQSPSPPRKNKGDSARETSKWPVFPQTSSGSNGPRPRKTEDRNVQERKEKSFFPSRNTVDPRGTASNSERTKDTSISSGFPSAGVGPGRPRSWKKEDRIVQEDKSGSFFPSRNSNASWDNASNGDRTKETSKWPGFPKMGSGPSDTPAGARPNNFPWDKTTNGDRTEEKSKWPGYPRVGSGSTEARPMKTDEENVQEGKGNSFFSPQANIFSPLSRNNPKRTDNPGRQNTALKSNRTSDQEEITRPPFPSEFVSRGKRAPLSVKDADVIERTGSSVPSQPADSWAINSRQSATAASKDRNIPMRALSTLKRTEDIWAGLAPIQVQGGDLKTCNCVYDYIERMQVFMKTDGGPLNSYVELQWGGPDTVPFKMNIYVEDGSVRPFSFVVETPGGSNALAIRNTDPSGIPLSASVELNLEENDPITNLSDLRDPMIVAGESTETFPLATDVSIVKVLLKTDGPLINARVELLQGPNFSKQCIDIYSEDGNLRPFYALIETPGSANKIKIINKAPIEYPLYAVLEPCSFEEYIL